jgi:hypothetical protein
VLFLLGGAFLLPQWSPLWVISGRRNPELRCPLSSQEQTRIDVVLTLATLLLGRAEARDDWKAFAKRVPSRAQSYSVQQ